MRVDGARSLRVQGDARDLSAHEWGRGAAALHTAAQLRILTDEGTEGSVTASVTEGSYRCVVVSRERQLGAGVAASLAHASLVVTEVDPSSLSTGANFAAHALAKSFADADVVAVVDGGDAVVDLVGEVVRAAKAHPPIVVAVAAASPGMLESVTAAGADDLVVLDDQAVALRLRLVVHGRAHKALVAARAASMSGEFFEKNPFAYYIVGSGGRIERVNGRFHAITGYGTAAVEGKTIEDLLARDDPKEIYGYHRAKIRYQDKAFEYECSLVHESGERIRVVLSMNIVVQGGYGIGALHDVTEARRLQREIETRNKLLEESTARLRETQEELNRTTRLATLGEISAQVAHEVLNPLTAVGARLRKMRDAAFIVDEITGYAREAATIASSVVPAADHALFESVPIALAETNQGLKDDVQFVLGEIGRVQKLIDGMRSQTPAERVMAKLPVLELLRYAGEVMADPLERSRVTFTFDCPEDIVVTVDRGEFIQVLTNLMRNSIESIASLPDSTRRAIAIDVNEADGTARINLRDSGTGVPTNMQTMIFEPTVTSKRNGTGIGLPISRRLLRGYGGDLQYDGTAPGPGATFVITLPAVRERVWKG